jgi:hypothetical protein
MARSTSPFSYANTLRRSAGRDGGSQRPPVLVPPLHHVPALSANAVFIDLRMVKPSVTTEERKDFLLKDLRVSVDEVSEIWPESESQLLRLVFFTADQYRRYHDHLTAGVPWSACRGDLVYGRATLSPSFASPASPPRYRMLPSGSILASSASLQAFSEAKTRSSPGQPTVSHTYPSPSPLGSHCLPSSRWLMQMAAQTSECWSKRMLGRLGQPLTALLRMRRPLLPPQPPS